MRSTPYPILVATALVLSALTAAADFMPVLPVTPAPGTRIVLLAGFLFMLAVSGMSFVLLRRMAHERMQWRFPKRPWRLRPSRFDRRQPWVPKRGARREG